MSTVCAPRTEFTALADTDTAGLDAVGCSDGLRQIRRVRGWLDSVEAQVSRQLDDLHALGQAAPSVDEFTRCSGTSSAEGNRRERRSKTLGDVPSFDTSLAAGAITAEHVDALAGVTGNLADDIKTEVLTQEADLLASAESRTPEEFRRDVKDLVATLERQAGIDRDEQQRRNTWVQCKPDPSTGMYNLRGKLHPELGSKISRALSAEARAERCRIDEAVTQGRMTQAEADSYTNGRLNAEALGSLIETGHAETRSNTPDMIICVDWHTLLHNDNGMCESSDGIPIPVETARRIACFADVTIAVLDANGVVTRLGHTKRAPNRDQLRALRAMYRTCAVGGCDIVFDRCEIHHVLAWQHGGTTDLDNLVPLCVRHHHRAAHGTGWTLTLDPTDRELTITSPTGQQQTCYPDSRPDTTAGTTAGGTAGTGNTTDGDQTGPNRKRRIGASERGTTTGPTTQPNARSATNPTRTPAPSDTLF